MLKLMTTMLNAEMIVNLLILLKTERWWWALPCQLTIFVAHTISLSYTYRWWKKYLVVEEKISLYSITTWEHWDRWSTKLCKILYTDPLHDIWVWVQMCIWVRMYVFAFRCVRFAKTKNVVVFVSLIIRANSSSMVWKGEFLSVFLKT